MTDITYLTTPYFQTISDSNADSYDGFLQYNYKSYNLFALKSRLTPIAKNRLSLPIIVRFDDRYLKNRVMVTVEFWLGDKPLSLSNSDKNYLQRALDNIISYRPNLILLLEDGVKWVSNLKHHSQGQRSMLPPWWISDITKHLTFDNDIRAHYRQLDTYQASGIYIDLSEIPNYADSFKIIYKNTLQQLDDMYEKGFISLHSGFNINKLVSWRTYPLRDLTTNDANSLRPVLFKPNWEDGRLTKPVGGMVEFLYKHLVRSSNKLLLHVGRGSIIRHQVSTALRLKYPVDSYVFRDDMVEITVNNLFEAQQAASLVDKSKTIPVGKVLSFYFPTPYWYNLYLATLLQITDEEKISNGLVDINTLGYKVDDVNLNYCLSIQIPYYANGNYYRKMVRIFVQSQVSDIKSPIELVKPSIETPTKIKDSKPPQIRLKHVKPYISNAKIIPEPKGDLKFDRLPTDVVSNLIGTIPRSIGKLHVPIAAQVA